jgi:epoxyqueuosine reductase
MTRLSEIWNDIASVAAAHSVLRVGAADIDDAHAELTQSWIASGHHASMSYLEKNAAIRRDPHLRFPWAKSAIVILVPYSSSRPAADPSALTNHLARYALGDDYHDTLDRILRDFERVIGERAAGTMTWRYVDTGPLSDRSLAAQAGLGWIAKNSMLIAQEHGSYFFIGTLLTSLENDIRGEEAAERCGTCTRCIDACPTAAILPDRTVSSRLCISYQTIEHRGALDEDVAERIGQNAFGCDICQEVCPWNDDRSPASHPAFIARDEYRATPVSDLLRMTQADFSALFRRSAVKRAKLVGMKRNVEAVLKKR